MVRLVNGQNHCQGRVEVYHNGTWGTVCDDLWGLCAAHVVCRQLGCGQGLGALGSGHFGEGSGPILLDDVQCRGHETSLGQCRHLGLSIHNCGHHEDAGVVCSGNPTFSGSGRMGGCRGPQAQIQGIGSLLLPEGSWVGFQLSLLASTPPTYPKSPVDFRSPPSLPPPPLPLLPGPLLEDTLLCRFEEHDGPSPFLSSTPLVLRYLVSIEHFFIILLGKGPLGSLCSEGTSDMSPR